jgi:hypothetical protein
MGTVVSLHRPIIFANPIGNDGVTAVFFGSADDIRWLRAPGIAPPRGQF